MLTEVAKKEFFKYAAPAISKLTRQAAESAGKAIFEGAKSGTQTGKIPVWKQKLQNTYLNSKQKDVYV